ncbi:MAG: ATP-binding protein [Planctomycetota bacterium]|nr:ATP-binding protein [Planctomycetota bacterium]MDA0935121.1 ATP-binding protein [Planctomycetota bacterium]
MGFINLADKTISAKLVYYGCGMGGKTTSLQAVHEIMCPRNEVQLVSIKTEEDATLLFDFLPIDLGEVEGFKVRIQGFTVPGQPKYRRMRKYVLSGADAVVFVVDSETSRLEENLQSFESLKENLALNGLDPDSIPIVLQYNKRDLEDVLSESELDRHFKFREELQAFPSVATEGRGVFETFVHAAGQLVDAKIRLYGLGRGKIDSAVVAEGARQKLWEIFDQSEFASRLDTTRRAGSVEMTFDDEGRSVDVDALPELEPFDDVEPSEELFSEDDLLSALDPDATADRDVRPQSAGTGAGGSVDDEEPLPALLDATVASNLEFAQRFGELDRYRVALERKNRELVQETQNIIHDLNRPLSALRLMLSSMRKGYLGKVDDVANRALDNAMTAVQQMDRLVGDLLESSRLDFDGVKLDFQPVDLDELVGEVIEAMRLEIDERGVDVRFDHLPKSRCDRFAMVRVFQNLLGNAVQYSATDRPAKIFVSAVAEEDRYVIQVSDNGMGIPAKDVARLFQRFERGSNTGGISGTGLGLHITREIVLGHGGDVWVDSVEGQGTTFSVALPFEPVQPPHSHTGEVPAPRSLVSG